GGGTPIPGRNEIRLKSRALREIANQLGMYPGAKRITADTERCSSDFTRGLLRGLFDADGSVQGTQDKVVSIRLTQVELGNLEAVQRMLLRLGIVSTIYRDRRAAQA